MLSLVGERTSPRPTAAPGAMAWLRLELDRYEQHIADPDRAAVYRGLASPAARVPDSLGPIADALVAPPPDGADAGALVRRRRRPLRRRRHSRCDANVSPSSATARFVVTRGRWLDADVGPTERVNRLVRAAVALLDLARTGHRANRLESSAAGGARHARRRMRSASIASPRTARSCRRRRRVTAAQDAAHAKNWRCSRSRPGVPSFAPQDFFFHFDPSMAAAPPDYSGFYLDLGGRGLVSTITAPIDVAGERAIAAIDLAFDIDWQTLASNAEPPIAGTAVQLTDRGVATWTTLDAAVAATAPAALRQAVRALADAERQTGSRDDASPLRHGIVPGGGAVAAFQVSGRVWLLMLFPPAQPAFPLAAVALLAGVLALLFAGFEFNRRRAEDERLKAERVFAEKQNLLNTMQVPLVVVDPNSDVIVSANRAADAIGVRAGARFADIVWPDERSRAYYERMQVASPEPRRAYGLPVAVRDENGRIVRAIRGHPIGRRDGADRGARRPTSGIASACCSSSTKPTTSRSSPRIVDARAHREERQRLAGLLTHGVDTLARVLEHCLTAAASPARTEFAAWLADYLERRITVTAWLLDHWDAVPPLARRFRRRSRAGAGDARQARVGPAPRARGPRTAVAPALGQRHALGDRRRRCGHRRPARLAAGVRLHLTRARRRRDVPRRSRRQRRPARRARLGAADRGQVRRSAVRFISVSRTTPAATVGPAAAGRRLWRALNPARARASV